MSYQINEVKSVAFDIIDVTEGASKNDRYRLASVVEIVLAVESFFPRKPISLTRNVPSTLRRKVDTTCPLCIKPDEMFAYMEETKTKLRRYLEDLKNWLSEYGETIEGTEQTGPVNVHELEPTLKNAKDKF